MFWKIERQLFHNLHAQYRSESSYEKYNQQIYVIEVIMHRWTFPNFDTDAKQFQTNKTIGVCKVYLLCRPLTLHYCITSSFDFILYMRSLCMASIEFIICFINAGIVISWECFTIHFYIIYYCPIKSWSAHDILSVVACHGVDTPATAFM